MVGSKQTKQINAPETDAAQVSAAQWMAEMLPLLEAGHNLAIYPEGVSMVPFFAGGRDSAILSAVDRPLKRGDIVLYQRENGIFVLHRIYRVRPDGYYMLGDAHTWVEGPVKRADVFALAVALNRKGKHFSCANRLYRFCAWLWLLGRPLRPLAFQCWRCKNRVFRN